MSKKLKVLLLFHTAEAHPRGYDYKEEFADPDNMYTENDAYQALKELGHDVSLLGIFDNINVLFEEIKENRPDVIFNMVEVFNNNSYFEKNIAAVLEMMGIPFTGSSSGCLFLCNNKALSKKILTYHRIKVSNFFTFYRGHKVWLPKKLRLPVIIKPLCEEASRGISQASLVDKEDAFIERIKFIHEKMNMDAIVEEYIGGRELYVTVMGHKRLTVLPYRELVFSKAPDGEPWIATYKAKWDDEYRERWGIKSVNVPKFANGLEKKIRDVCTRAYRALDMNSYTRFDIRVTEDEQVYIIEPNANPCIAKSDEVAESADKAGISYPQLLQKIINLALQSH